MTAHHPSRVPAATCGGETGPAWSPGSTAGALAFGGSLVLLLAVFQAFARHPWSMLDLRVYVWGGGLARHEQDPYLHTYLHALRFTYTPAAAAVFALTALIKLAVVKGIVTAASIVSLVGVLWLTWGSLRQDRPGGRVGATLAVAAVALWIEPVRQTLSFGQINLILMLVIMADLCASDSRWWKGVGVGLAAGFKLTPLIFIPYLLLTRRFRAAAVATLTFALTIGISAVLMPAAAEHFWSDGLFLHANRVGNLRFIGNQSLYGAILRLSGSAAEARPYQVLAALATGTAGLLVAAWASRRGHELIGILVCAVTGLLVSPVSWSHHWVWVAPILVVLADLAMRPASSLSAARHPRLPGRLGAAAVLLLFSGLIWTVPARAAPGYVMTGVQQFVGDLYVLAGLAGLGVIAGLLALEQHRERHGSAATAGGTREGPLALPG